VQAHGPWTKALDFGGNPDHIMLRLVRVELCLGLGWARDRPAKILRMSGRVTVCVTVTIL